MKRDRPPHGRWHLTRARFAAWLLLFAVLAGAHAVGGRVAVGASQAPETLPATSGMRPNLHSNIERPLRYRPDGTDFVIENGAEFFNRPLYGGHTAFRVDAGDRPEVALYLPGRGGNLRIGVRAPGGSTWLHDARHIVARYRPGSMIYEIRDPLLGSGVVRLTILALRAREGLIARVDASGVSPDLELVWAYGGVSGQRGQRDGDIGTEQVPISEYFQLKPEYCVGNVFTLGRDGFVLRAGSVIVRGVVPAGARQDVADAGRWASIPGLLQSAGSQPALPVVVGHVTLAGGAPVFLLLEQMTGSGATEGAAPAAGLGSATDLPALLAEADDGVRAIREQVSVDTPDLFVNAAVAALCIAADAVWDEPSGTVLHGAVAWRSRLLGWRGPYAMDALGWHDRARRHLTYWAGRQNTDPIPSALPPPDAGANLARSETALQSNGALSSSHYDMNLVYIDALMRHLMWTGDLGYARQVWPVIERHLAWERRLFRREFGPDKLPLYEAYAAIWASDDLEYDGGGVTHASAYNYFHNRTAARLARLLGYDPAPYEREAEGIARAMRKHLWLEDRGAFAEFKDLLGLQLVHPSAGLWTFYHAMDAGLPTPLEAWRMTRAVDTRMPHLPVRGAGVPADQSYAVLSTTDWMPYTWSANNVVMGENIHAALGYWQAGRADEAFRLMKSALLASMFMGICPGNVGSMNDLDVYRRESQRDFADGSGVFARALLEGLFGIHPDALDRTLRVAPGFPEAWDHARLRHRDLTLDYRRSGMTEEYAVESRFPMPLALTLDVPARRARVTSVTVNGRPASWRVVENAVVNPRIEIPAGTAPTATVVITWAGEALRRGRAPDGERAVRKTKGMMSWWEPVQAAARIRPVPPARVVDWRTPEPAPVRWEEIELGPYFNDRVTEIFKTGKYLSPRSPFCSLAIPSQGIGAWAGHVNAMTEIDDRGLREVAGRNGGRLVLPNGVPFATSGPADARNIVFTSQWDNYPREAVVPIGGRARTLYLLMAGSTNHMQSRIDNGEVVVTYSDGSTSRLALQNPTTWWPIDQDYFIDDYAFARPEPIPPRIDLKTGEVCLLDPETFKGRGGVVPGGAATALALPLDPVRDLRSLTIRTLANEVVIGLMAATLARPDLPVPMRFSFATSTASGRGVAVTRDTVYSDERGFGFEPDGEFRRFSVRVPEEGNYRVRVSVGGLPTPSSTTIRAELRRLMVERVDTLPGRLETVTFIVNTRTPVIRAAGGIQAGEVALKVPRETITEAAAWDRKLTLDFGGAAPAVAALEVTPVMVPTVFLLGDSTVCDQPAAPYSSWGQMLPRFFRPTVAVANHAESGESYRDSLGRRRLDKILSVMKPGDYVFMQFGHNDQKQIAAGTGGPFTSYMAELRQHVEAVRRARGVPVVVSPVERRTFDDAGRFVPSLAEYAEAARRAARQLGVAFIDLNAMSRTFYEALGPEKSKAAFAEPEPGQIDNSHHSAYGAYELAKCVLEGIRHAHLGLAAQIMKDFRGFDPARPDPVDRFTSGF